MEEESLSHFHQEILKGFKQGGIGFHGTFSGNVENIITKGLKTPHELGLQTTDNKVCYYTTPSQDLINAIINYSPSNDRAADTVVDALKRAIGTSIGGYALHGETQGGRIFNWNNWQNTPELLPALVFFSNSGEVRPVGKPMELSAKGDYIGGKITLPEVRSSDNIDAENILGYVQITPDEVELLQEGLNLDLKKDQVVLNRRVRERITVKAIEFLISQN